MFSDDNHLPPPLFSCGIDLVDTARIKAALERGGDSFVQRVFTVQETAYCRRHQDPAPRFAARFAAKEAMAKAFGTGIGEACAFAEIEVIHSAEGAPQIRLHGQAAATAAAQRIFHISLSLSHTASQATAIVVVQRSPARPGPVP